MSYVHNAVPNLSTIDCSGFYKKSRGPVLVIKGQRFYDDEEVVCEKVLQAKILPPL